MNIKNIEMVRKKNIPIGYEKGTLYLKPKEWLEKSLDDISITSDYGTSEKTNSEVGIPVLRMGNMKEGKIDTNDLVYLELNKEQLEKLKLNKGDILFNRTNSYDLVGKVSLFDIDGDYVCASYIVRFKINNKLIDSRYVAYFMNLPKSQEYIKMLSTKGVQQVNVNPTTLRKYFKISFPKNLNEQRYILDILDNWNKAITLKEKLLKEKQKQKKGLMERLLTGKIRLNGSNEKVKIEKLKNYIFEVKEKNKDNKETRILSVTNKQGFILQEEQFEHIVASSNLSNYKIVKKGQFAYNPSRINVGSIDLLTRFESGVLSPMYVVFQCKQDLNSEYLYQFLKSDLFLRYIPKLLQGSVRDSLSFDALEQVKLFIPSLEEQKQIGNLLKIADKEIELLQKEINLLKEQKKGLMQLLLTGIVRVRCD